MMKLLKQLFFFGSTGEDPYGKAPDPRLERALKEPVLCEEYPKACECGYSKSWQLVRYENHQVQKCPECGSMYRSRLCEAVGLGRCPDCNGQLFEGPCGGAAMNVACANGHKFNLYAPFGHVQVDRL